LRRSLGRHLAERLPHVHHRKANALALFWTEPVVECSHAGLRPIGTAKPDRPATQKIAHHDAIGVTFADRDLIDTDHFGSWRAGARPLRCHVLFIEVLYRLPIEVELFGNVLDRRLTAASADKIGKALGVEWIVGQKVEPFAFHFATNPAKNASNLDFEKYARVRA